MRLPGGRLMRVFGRSMQPALSAGDLVFVDTRTLVKRPPKRGEVVAACLPANRRWIIKRLAGLPNDRLTVDGKSYQLKEGEYFLLGDSSIESTDSRSFGPVDRKALLGVVTRRVWPFSRIATACSAGFALSENS